MKFLREYKYAFLFGFMVIAVVQWISSISLIVDAPDTIEWIISYIWFAICMYGDYLYNMYRDKKEDNNA